MPSPLETWFSEIPPITRIYVSAACCTSIAVQLGFIHPLQLWLNYESIVHDYQWWRLITNFFYFGPLSIDFCFHVFFLARYSRMMEEGFFRNKPADYVWLMLFSAGILILLSILVPFAYLPFMGSALSFTMVYIWARRNPYVRLNFLGLIVFTAPYLPWVLLIFSLCLGGQVPVGDMLGILVGHIYYFFEDVWPRDPISNGKKWLATPRFIRWLIEGNRARDDSIEIQPIIEQLETLEINDAEPLLNNENTTDNESNQGDSTRAQEENTLTERKFGYTLGDEFSDNDDERNETIATKTTGTETKKTETKETETMATCTMKTETIATPSQPPQSSSTATTFTSNNNNNITSSYSAYNSNNDTPSN